MAGVVRKKGNISCMKVLMDIFFDPKRDIAAKKRKKKEKKKQLKTMCHLIYWI